jgi:hypothetical protein
MAADPALAALPAPAAKALTCPNCGGTIELRAAGYTVTLVCQYCTSMLDVASPEVRLIAAYHSAALQLEIPLGTRGTLRGVEWEAIGYVKRSEGGAYPWEEYLLFNPYHGYRWLVTNGRGWSLGELLTRTPGWGNGAIAYADDLYEPFFSNGTARVDYVLGEFYWRVQVGEQVQTDDYVRPGFMLSREANEKEVAWTLLELLQPREIEAAFGVQAPRKPWPPLPHQPSPHRDTLRTAAKLGFAAAALLLLAAIVFGGERTLFSGSVPARVGEGARSATIGPITLTRPHQAVTIRARAPWLDNAWIDLDYALVDRRTQAAWQAYGVAERYSGRDSDGSWTEGSARSRVKIARVPAGTYDLVVEHSAQRWTGSTNALSGLGFNADPRDDIGEREIDIEVRRSAVFFSNYLLAAILILFPLIFILSRHVRFEQARQDQGDHGRTGIAKAFTSDGGDDDE